MRASRVLRSISPLSATRSRAAPLSGIQQSSTPAPITSLINPLVPATYLTPTRPFSSHSHSLKSKHQAALVKQLGGGVRHLSSKDETVGQDDQTPMTKEDRDQALQQVPAGEMTGTDKWIRRLGWLGGFYSRRQVLLRSTRKIYLATCDHTHDSELYEICGLPDTFQSWFLVQQLHVWMLMVRSKADGSEGKQFHKSLVQFFWDDVEHRMTLMRVEDVTIKTESNRELNSMFYGLLFAYDEGIAKGDQV